jgi:hypothetical protein
VAALAMSWAPPWIRNLVPATDSLAVLEAKPPIGSYEAPDTMLAVVRNYEKLKSRVNKGKPEMMLEGSERDEAIAAAKRSQGADTAAPAPARWQHPTNTQAKPEPPKMVTIVCQGPTQQSYRLLLDDYQRELPEAEVWILNKAARYLRGDLLWVMDDLEVERRKSGEYFRDLMGAGLPIMTCSIDRDSTQFVPPHMRARVFEYPLLQVIDYWGAKHIEATKRGLSCVHDAIAARGVRAAGLHCAAYFHNSLPYMLAYAGFIGVTELHLFGADYTYGNQSLREDGRANAEYWIGMLRASGVRVRLSSDTTLLSQHRQPWFYGFARQPVIEGL